MLRVFTLLAVLVGLTACTYESDLKEPPVYLGDFQLGHNVVVAPKAETSAAVSREVSEEELTTALKEAIAKRFDRYEGSRRYHLGVSIEGYILARAGVPVVAAPKSAMIIRVTVWDDAEAKKLNVPPEQLTIIENLDGESLFGTGWTQDSDEQLEGLARNAAKAIETFLVKQNEEQGWFGGGVIDGDDPEAGEPQEASDEETASNTVESDQAPLAEPSAAAATEVETIGEEVSTPTGDAVLDGIRDDVEAQQEIEGTQEAGGA